MQGVCRGCTGSVQEGGCRGFAGGWQGVQVVFRRVKGFRRRVAGGAGVVLELYLER